MFPLILELSLTLNRNFYAVNSTASIFLFNVSMGDICTTVCLGKAQAGSNSCRKPAQRVSNADACVEESNTSAYDLTLSKSWKRVD